jgi:hypothetical protein
MQSFRQQSPHTHITMSWLSLRFIRRVVGFVTQFFVSVILLLSPLAFGQVGAYTIPASERAALLSLYASTNGVKWASNLRWGGAVGTECTWIGVKCTYITNATSVIATRVMGVSLANNNLVGTLPDLSGLSALEEFGAERNKLTGSIPPSLSGLTALRYVNVSDNQLTGSIPSLSGLTALSYVNLGNNRLTGPIPSLRGLTALSFFHVAGNQLTGSIPSLSGLTALSDFAVGYNKLTGTIPSLSGLTALRQFIVGLNQLIGPIPSLSGLTALTYFSADNNQLTGTLPSLSGLTALRWFRVDNNQLSGPVPAPPTSLVNWRYSSICGNYLQLSGSPSVDQAWDMATADNGQARPPSVNGKPDWLVCQKSLSLLNPLKTYYLQQGGSLTVDPAKLLTFDAAQALSADGASAVLVALNSASQNAPVTFTVSPYGILTPFNPNYLSNPTPAEGASSSLQVPAPVCNAAGCNHLALLWSPPSLPAGAGKPMATLTVTATQSGVSAGQATINLQPPPLLLVHGIWSRPADAGFSSGSGGFGDWIASQYPANALIDAVDYGDSNYKAFNSTEIQNRFETSIQSLLAKAANAGIAARQVDVVGHSMGGLVTRYFFLNKMSRLSRIPDKSLHSLITIGTPHQGSPLAKQLKDKANSPALGTNWLNDKLCEFYGACTLGGVLEKNGKKVDTGVDSLIAGSDGLKALNPINPLDTTPYKAIVGIAPQVNVTGDPPTNITQWKLNLLVTPFFPIGTTIDSLMQTTVHDTIVPAYSQSGGAVKENMAIGPCSGAPSVVSPCSIAGIVHSSLSSWDIGETASPAVWNQTFSWLTGLQPTVVAKTVAAAATTATKAGPAPIFDLNGYTSVAASNVNFTPVTNSTLTIGKTVNIVATSTTKTILQVLLFEVAASTAEPDLQYVTQAPFSIPFTPFELGSAKFIAFAVFSDRTYAAVDLTYKLQAEGAPTALDLTNVPTGIQRTGITMRVGATALFKAGPVDVTSAASYTVRSGTSAVIRAAANGIVTTIGGGTDWLDVTYLGLKTSMEISVAPSSSFDAPTLTSAVAGAARITVNFVVPVSSGGSTITSYTASCNATGQTTLTASGTASPIVIRGLTVGVAYTCSVTANYSAGGSAVSTASPPIAPLPSAKPTTATIYGDGRSALMWRNSNGAATVWRHSGSASAAGFTDTGVTYGPFAGWTLVNSDGDYDGDGKGDLLWQRTDGAISIWLMNGTTIKSQSQFGPYAGWSFFSGNSDFNGDGKSDIIWQRTDGAISIWLMNGNTQLQERVHGPFAGWSLLSATNDFDGDGKADLLWKKNSGSVSLWLMDGANTKQVSPEYGPYAGWTVISGSSDYNGDGKTDLTWERSDNAVIVWTMNGVTKTAESPQFGPYAGWRIVAGERDFDGDGKSDLLWQRTDGAATVWLMAGAAMPAAANMSAPLLPVGSNWSLLGAYSDFNGDGKTDLVWQSATGQIAIGLANGVVPPAPALFGPYSGWSHLVGKTVP